MNTNEMTDKFSWERVKEVARFYYPSYRLPLMVYPVVSLVFAIMYVWLTEYPVAFMLFSLATAIPSFMFYLFPLFFCRRQSPVTETMLPATTAEKFTFFAILCVPVNGLLLLVPSAVVMLIAYGEGFMENVLAEVTTIGFDFMAETYGLSMMQYLVPLATCFFIVFSRWRNRIGMGIGMTIVSWVAYSIISGITVGIMLFMSPEFEQLLENAGNEGYDVGVYIGQRMGGMMKTFIYVSSAIAVVYFSLMMYLTYRKMRTRQF